MGQKFRKIFYVTLFITINVNAQQCVDLFKNTTAQTASVHPNYQDIVDQIKTALSDLDSRFADNDRNAAAAQSNQDINNVVQNSVELGNRALKVFETIVTHQSIFRSLDEKNVRNEFVNGLFGLFLNQGLTKEQVTAIFDSRVTLAIQLNELRQQQPRPIGFTFQPETVSNQSTPRTIGFIQNQLELEPYGRVDKPKIFDSSHNDVSKRNPIGFIPQKTNSDKNAKPMMSIGFVQTEELIDIGYRLYTDFDFKNSTFLARTDRKPIGF